MLPFETEVAWKGLSCVRPSGSNVFVSQDWDVTKPTSALSISPCVGHQRSWVWPSWEGKCVRFYFSIWAFKFHVHWCNTHNSSQRKLIIAPRDQKWAIRSVAVNWPECIVEATNTEYGRQSSTKPNHYLPFGQRIVEEWYTVTDAYILWQSTQLLSSFFQNEERSGLGDRAGNHLQSGRSMQRVTNHQQTSSTPFAFIHLKITMPSSVLHPWIKKTPKEFIF